MTSEPMLSILLSLLAVIVLFLAMWLLSLRTRDVGAVDIVWGPGFALIAWLEWLRLAPQHGSSTLLLLAVTLWAARLGAHLLARHRLSVGEDARYAAMRAADPGRFWWSSLYKVFVLQAAMLSGLARFHRIGAVRSRVHA
jgi:steroid 5-alpha reductase family enzyme